MTAIRLPSTVYLAAIARIAEEWSPSPSAVFGEILTPQPRTDRPAVFYLSKMGAPCPHIVRPPVGFRRVTSR